MGAAQGPQWGWRPAHAGPEGREAALAAPPRRGGEGGSPGGALGARRETTGAGLDGRGERSELRPPLGETGIAGRPWVNPACPCLSFPVRWLLSGAAVGMGRLGAGMGSAARVSN